MTTTNIASIAPCAPLLDLLDYAVPEGLQLEAGMVVIIPLRNKEILGIVWQIKSFSEHNKLREVIEIVDDLLISSMQRSFLNKLAQYYVSPLGSVIKMVLNFDKLEQQPILQHTPQQLPALSHQQQQVMDEIQTTDKPSLLKGVTGSGKTEVYFHLINQYLKQEKQILVMIPEIGLSSQIISRFKARFGFAPLVWNSSITKAKRRKLFNHIIHDKQLVIFGTRSSLLLPYKNLGLIIVDEEQDASYKQEDSVRYNARDMAVLRSTICKHKTLLLSATPAIETIYNIQQGKYHLAELTSRFGEAKIPKVKTIDMRAENLPANEWLSQPLLTQLRQTLDTKSQSLLFLNRKGYSPLILCRHCGHRINCPNCSSYLVMHKGKKRLQCHLCDYVRSLPSHCPECKNQDELASIGPGIERIAEEVALKLPAARILTVSREDMSTQRKIDSILKVIENGEVDIIIGTQIITKGYHFPKLTLVGIIDADTGLIGGDLRASEQTYQLLHQVGGRAGRESKNGTVLIQTYHPSSKMIKALQQFNDKAFLSYELETRQTTAMPPFKRMASIILQGKYEQKLLQITRQLVQMAPLHPNIRILGPAPSLIAKIGRMHRMRIILLCDKSFNLQQYIKQWLRRADTVQKLPSGIKLTIDIDPYNLM